ncbi:MAG: UPF0158 family protein [Chlamydiia bacterium]|nr:UPF0158 family protein [Chlamydiia bacterium]
MAKKTVQPQALNPLILRNHRLIEAFTKSNDETDYYLDRYEGFIIGVDLDKTEEEIIEVEKEIVRNSVRYIAFPKLTFYETKKIMEGFVNEKVYDIDTKEKLMEVIQSKEAMANFLDFLFDLPNEYEKWQQYYQERTRIRMIEWLREYDYQFVFEEDLDLPKQLLEKVKESLFEAKAAKDVLSARKTLFNKAKTYYSSEALNPRPKRGRPPKQTAKLEVEPQVTRDIYTTVPTPCRPFLYSSDFTSTPADAFSERFAAPSSTPKEGGEFTYEIDVAKESLQKKLAMLKQLSKGWEEEEEEEEEPLLFDAENEEDEEESTSPTKTSSAPNPPKKRRLKPAKKRAESKKKPVKKKEAPKKKSTPVKRKLSPRTKRKTAATPPTKSKHK